MIEKQYRVLGMRARFLGAVEDALCDQEKKKVAKSEKSTFSGCNSYMRNKIFLSNWCFMILKIVEKNHIA